MSPQLNSLTEKLDKKTSPDIVVFERILSHLGFGLPDDYLEFMKSNDGGEGFIGGNKYLCIWSVENLIDWNKKYNVEMYAPGYFVFASDGDGTAYAFDKKTSSIVAFQFIGMLMEDESIV